MHVIITLGLTCFSFYYTEKVVDFVSMQDPIMKEILKNKDNFEIDAIDAYIDDDNIIPGVNGTVVDSKESFKKMKNMENIMRVFMCLMIKSLLFL